MIVSLKIPHPQQASYEVTKFLRLFHSQRFIIYCILVLMVLALLGSHDKSTREERFR
jgi:hypothetical protein